MWILESSSELFQGRRMWLKPGKSYLFGRVKNDGVRFAIEHKTISRKHFIIKVDEVQIEDVGNIHTRTKVVIEDQNSKAGTTVNGEHIKGSSKELKQEENYIKPGNLPTELVLKWHPYVLTYNLLKKEIKTGLLQTKQGRVKDLDIKAVSEYVTGQTTHLVVNKRNTPKSLQALIEGRPLVAESYIDALEYAATPTDLNEEENLSPLEQDFDSAWPDPFDHLPPPGREPTSRSAESYKPDPRRRHVFENLTFVFVDQNQYDNLLPPITTGHGKALLHKIVLNETTAEDLVSFLRNTAGEKSFGDTQRDIDHGGVILVRYKGDTGAEDWTNTLINETCLKLDQRAIDQGEFLDAILANNGLLLRQAVPFESNHNGASATVKPATVAPVQQSSPDQAPASEPRTLRPSSSLPASTSQLRSRTQANNPEQEQTSGQGSESTQPGRHIHPRSPDLASQEPPTKRARFMIPKKSKVFDFDDDFDPNRVIAWQDDEEDSAAQTTQGERPATPSAESEPDIVKPEPASARKRARSPNEAAPVGDDHDMDDLLPAAALMKRRKLAKESRDGAPSVPVKSKPIPMLLKKARQEKDIDVLKEVAAQRKAEEDIKKEQEDNEDDLRLEPGEKMPIYDVETVLIEVPNRERTSHEASQTGSERWDPKWNGRKNFKGFRRAKDNPNGDSRIDPRRRNHTKVIVPLVDARTSTYGMGDQYWDKTAEEKRRDREKKIRASQRTTQSQSDQSRVSRQQRSPTIHVSDGDDHDDAAMEDATHTSPELSRLQNEAAEITNHEIDVDAPRQTRVSDTQPQTQTTTTGSTVSVKRTNGIGRGGMAKKQSSLPVTTIHGSDSDDSDDMKFKFGSRRRGRGR